MPISTPFAIAAGCYGLLSVVLSPDTLFFNLMLAATGGTMIICILLGFAVALFNQPKFIVYPYMREQPGALSVWRENHKKN